jgi:hypothetical protein
MLPAGSSRLSPNFVPGPFDVICGRGKTCKRPARLFPWRLSFFFFANWTSSPIKILLLSCADCQKTGYGYEGNLKLCELVRQYTKEYSAAKTKDEKSHIVSLIAAEVHRLSPNGGFIKKDQDGWFEVGAFLAREKISQVFRNILQDNYKSSTRMRRVVRQAQRQLLRSRNPSSATTTTAATTTTTTPNGASSPNDSVTGKHWAVIKQ